MKDLIRQIELIDKSQKKRFLITLVTVVGLMVICVSLVVLRDIQETDQKAQFSKKGEYQEFIKKYSEREVEYEKKIKGIGHRAALSNEIDPLQNTILAKLQSMGLDTQSVAMIPTPKPAQTKDGQVNLPDGVEYDLVLKGTWNQTVDFLKALENEMLFINIKSVNFDIDGNQLRTSIRYKIYME